VSRYDELSKCNQTSYWFIVASLARLLQAHAAAFHWSRELVITRW